MHAALGPADAWRSGFARLAANFPETTIVLSHTGMPERLDEDRLALWSAGIRALASRPTTFAEVSGIGMTIHPWTVDVIRGLRRMHGRPSESDRADPFAGTAVHADRMDALLDDGQEP